MVEHTQNSAKCDRSVGMLPHICLVVGLVAHPCFCTATWHAYTCRICGQHSSTCTVQDLNVQHGSEVRQGAMCPSLNQLRRFLPFPIVGPSEPNPKWRSCVCVAPLQGWCALVVDSGMFKERLWNHVITFEVLREPLCFLVAAIHATWITNGSLHTILDTPLTKHVYCIRTHWIVIAVLAIVVAVAGFVTLALRAPKHR